MTSDNRNPARHEPNHPGSFDLRGLGPIDYCKQIVNPSKFSIILFSRKSNSRGPFRLYEFYRDPETGKVYLPHECGTSRALYEWLDSRYGVERIRNREATNSPAEYEYDPDDSEIDVPLPYQ